MMAAGVSCIILTFIAVIFTEDVKPRRPFSFGNKVAATLLFSGIALIAASVITFLARTMP